MKSCSTVFVTGLVLSASSLAVAGPVNAGFELNIGPVFAPGPLPPFTNGWALQSLAPLSSGSTALYISSYTLGVLAPTEGTSFALLETDGLATSTFLTSAPFTVGAAGATITYDHFFDTAFPGLTGIFGTATSFSGGGAVNLIPNVFPDPHEWTTSASVALGAGDWALSFNIISLDPGLPSAYFGLDNIVVTENSPIIPLPTGAAMAMVGMGVIGIRRRR